MTMADIELDDGLYRDLSSSVENKINRTNLTRAFISVLSISFTSWTCSGRKCSEPSQPVAAVLMGGTGNRIFFMCSSKNLSTLTVSLLLLVILDSCSVEGFELAVFSRCGLVLKFCKNDVSREKERQVSQVLVSKQCVNIWIYLLTK